MLKMDFNTISAKKDFGLRDFKKELKVSLEMAGIQNKKIVLFVEDHNLVQPEFLELLNSLISSGEIPGLYSSEEVEHLYQSPEEVRRESYGKSLYEVFCGQVKNNLRVVLSLDHKKSDFDMNCAQNPALFSKCAVIWLDHLSDDSQSQIVKKELAELMNALGEEEQQKLLILFNLIHKQGIESFLASPFHFFSFVQSFISVYTKKQSS